MLSERVEDYLEAIHNVHNRKGYVRVKDVANTLSITCPSVTEMLKKLVSLRLISYEKYGRVILTEKGSEIARTVKDRHDTLVKLLTLAGVPDDTADKDACVMEHHLSPVSLEQLKKLVGCLEGQDSLKRVPYAIKN
jgi:DtxR family Mn-dependent transcriptional regulator